MILDSPPAPLCHHFNLKTVDRSLIDTKTDLSVPAVWQKFESDLGCA